jgi:nitrite reductase/ring-hydroxylating ferredoxin subunit
LCLMKNLLTSMGIFLLGLLSHSCVPEPAGSSIPYAWVSFEIDVSTGGVHSSLRRDMLGNMIIFSTANPSILSSSVNAGYGFGGVIVVRGMDNELYAFDAACPYEHTPEIALTNDGYFVVCAHCKTQYDIASGWGTPNTKSGPGKERLKKYNVYKISESRYRVVN